ncbi:MAG: EamA family transporter [Burkholderiales bacterium]|nr:EamA family transporter [Burkholderiales bacterium]
MTAALSLPHALLALAVAFVWGTNFVVIRLALDVMPPLWMATLRFVFAALPAVLFLPRPKVPWRELAAYGVLIGAGQFGLLFVAMHGRISPGLASLVIQTQVFFTIGLAMLIAREALRPFQVVALAMAATGLLVIGVNAGGDITPLGLLMVLAAAFSWALGNMVSRRAGAVNMLAYVVWASLFSAPPLLLLSLLLEGPAAITQGMQRAGLGTWAAVLWQSVGNTLFGYAAWGWLLLRHPAATVSPWALAVPVFGMATSAWWLGEPLPAWKLVAAVLVVAGLALNLFWPRLREALRR